MAERFQSPVSNKDSDGDADDQRQAPQPAEERHGKIMVVGEREKELALLSAGDGAVSLLDQLQLKSGEVEDEASGRALVGDETEPPSGESESAVPKNLDGEVEVG